ncbi:hypothetical protein niasHT_021795 [Heterodera trifolii]|uniref:Chromatin modification-related protein MEAF6 n=1 Tax=Heterodera trifolii TaxID=157864 RepID=A0ABD2J8L2_9BILA
MTNARADAKQEMSELVKRRTDISIALANLEKQIYNFETTYLEEAMEHGGNVIRVEFNKNFYPFGKLLDSVNGSASSASAVSSSSSFFSSSANAKQKKAPKQQFTEMDRIFSLSSVTSPISSRLLELGTGIASSTEGGNPPNGGLPKEHFLVNGDKSLGRSSHSVRSYHQQPRKESSQDELLMAEEPRSDDDERTAEAAAEGAAVGRRGPTPKRRRTFVEH